MVEAVGKKETLADAIAMTAPGGTVAVVGAFQAPTSINAPRMQAKNVALVMGMGDLGCMSEMVEEIQAGRLDPSPMVTHRLAFGEVLEAYEIFDKKSEGAIKILLSI